MNNDNPDSPPTTKDTCDLHVKRIPKSIWLKARQNALLSSLSFRDYVIRVLDECQPVPGEPKGTAIPASVDPDKVSS